MSGLSARFKKLEELTEMIEVNQEETNSFLEETQENQRQVLENLNSSFNGEALQEIVNALEK
jgi:DNA-binding MurR/RpiR family transcriptional regulator